jgi:hypothetical protein
LPQLRLGELVLRGSYAPGNLLYESPGRFWIAAIELQEEQADMFASMAFQDIGLDSREESKVISLGPVPPQRAFEVNHRRISSCCP